VFDLGKSFQPSPFVNEAGAVSTDIVPNQFSKVLNEVLSSFFLPLTIYAQLSGKSRQVDAYSEAVFFSHEQPFYERAVSDLDP
jgi:hypothetical protein